MRQSAPTIALHSHSFTPALAAGQIELETVLRFFDELGVDVVELADALRTCLPLARRLGVVLTIPDVGIAAELSGTSEHLREICAAVGPELRVTYDVGNFLLAGEEPLPALERLADRIAHVHLKDWRVFPARPPPPPGSYAGLDGRHYLGLALGEGVLDLPSVVRRLAELGYRGCLSIEYEGTDDPS